jgi:myo-inositol-1(or 4)-monophosphatase
MGDFRKRGFPPRRTRRKTSAVKRANSRVNYRSHLQSAVEAVHSVGELLRKNLHKPKKIDSEQQHDIKLALDVRCQRIIEKKLYADFPEISVLGEEGNSGACESAARWVVDPIDGTVNFTYGIPHACVSIALQVRVRPQKGVTHPDAAYATVAGVVYDPFCDELWTALRGQPARLNGRKIAVSSRRRLDQTVISMGFAKKTDTLEQMLPNFNHLVHRVRKIRIMGAAALAMVYVASGRFDAYLESGVRLWDIAAGGLILESAGGEFWHQALDSEHAYAVIASNGPLRRQLQANLDQS